MNNTLDDYIVGYRIHGPFQDPIRVLCLIRFYVYNFCFEFRIRRFNDIKPFALFFSSLRATNGVWSPQIDFDDAITNNVYQLASYRKVLFLVQMTET